LVIFNAILLVLRCLDCRAYSELSCRTHDRGSRSATNFTLYFACFRHRLRVRWS
jgi:hypothetical protein